MSKKLLGLVMAAVVAGGPVASKAATFDGLYTGVGVGWFSESTKLSNVVNGVKKKHTFNQLPLSVQFGYVQSAPNCFLWGVGASFGYAFLNKKSSLGNFQPIDPATGVLAVDPATGAPVYASGSVQRQTRFFSDVAVRLGWNFDQFAAYVLGGFSLSQVKYQQNVRLDAIGYNGSLSKTKFTFGFFPGIGLEVKLPQEWSVGVEYKYHFLKKESLSIRGSKVNIKSDVSDLRLCLNYNF